MSKWWIFSTWKIFGTIQEKFGTSAKFWSCHPKADVLKMKICYPIPKQSSHFCKTFVWINWKSFLLFSSAVAKTASRARAPPAPRSAVPNSRHIWRSSTTFRASPLLVPHQSRRCPGGPVYTQSRTASWGRPASTDASCKVRTQGLLSHRLTHLLVGDMAVILKV